MLHPRDAEPFLGASSEVVESLESSNGLRLGRVNSKVCARFRQVTFPETVMMIEKGACCVIMTSVSPSILPVFILLLRNRLAIHSLRRTWAIGHKKHFD